MRVRPFEPKDEFYLRAMHLGHTFPLPTNLSEYSVVVDDLDQPIAAAGYKLVPEITLLCATNPHPVVKMNAISLLHQALRDKLGANHTEAFAFVEPCYERAFGRHLQRLFNWRETWKCFRVGIGGADA